MTAFLETLRPDDLIHFIESRTSHQLPRRRRSEYRGYMKSERGVLQDVGRLGIGLSIRHSEYVAKSRWRDSPLARAVLGFPQSSGEIMVMKWDDLPASQNIIVTPSRPDPVIVVQGDLENGPEDGWLVRGPLPEDLTLINQIIEAADNHPPMVE